MNPAMTLLSHPVAERAGWVLLHSLWQGSVIGAGFGLIRCASRRLSPGVRYLAGCVALFLLVVAPVMTVLIGTMPPPRSGAGPDFTGFLPHFILPASPPGGTGITHAEVQPAWFLQAVADFCGQIAPLLALLWLAGVAVGSIRLTRSWWWLRSLRSTENEPVNPVWLETLADLRCRLEITRPVRLLKSALVEVPTVIGWLRPVILLPAASLTGLTTGQLEAILAHELAHVRRFDYLVNAGQCLIETLVFYHPVMWWISRCVREEREHCCDDLVVKVCGDRLDYARALATLEEARSDLPEFAFAANGGSLLNRIRRLLGATDSNAPTTVRQAAGLGLLGIGFLLILLGVCLILSPSRYRSTARIKVAPESAQPGPSGNRQDADYDPYFIQTEFEVIQSEPVLLKVIESLDLQKAWADRHAGAAQLQASEAVALLRSQIELRTIRNTSLIEICASSQRPEEAARIANAVAEAYRNHRRDQEQKSADRGLGLLTERFDAQEAKIIAARTNVDFLRKTLRIPDLQYNEDMPSAAMSTETLHKIVAFRIERRAECKGMETLLRNLTNLPPEQLRQALPTASQDSLMSSLLEQLSLAQQRLLSVTSEFGPEHPELKKAAASVQDLDAKINRRVDGIILGLSARLAAVTESLKDLDRAADEAAHANIARAEEIRPYLEAKTKLNELERFRQLLTMKIAAEKIDQSLPRTMSVEIMDRATPPLRPIAPNRPRACALIVLGALLDLVGLRMVKSKPR